MARNGRRLSTAVLGMLLALAATGSNGFAGAVHPLTTVWQFPGGCGSATTLENCVDVVAQPGDTILIVDDTPIDEAVTITTSLTLRSAPGHHGTITKLLTVARSGGTIDVKLIDLTL